MSMFFSLMLTLLPTRASLLAEGFSAWITLKKKVFKGKDKQDQVYRKTLGVIKSSMCFSYEKNFLGVFFTLKIDHGRPYFIVILYSSIEWIIQKELIDQQHLTLISCLRKKRFISYIDKRMICKKFGFKRANIHLSWVRRVV